jgi:hypothetical protein
MKDAVEAAREMSDFVNNMSCDVKKFCETMSVEHRTLQQSFSELCFAWIRHCAEKYDEGRYDGRNEFSCKVSKEIVEKVEDAQYKMPFI